MMQECTTLQMPAVWQTGCLSAGNEVAHLGWWRRRRRRRNAHRRRREWRAPFSIWLRAAGHPAAGAEGGLYSGLSCGSQHACLPQSCCSPTTPPLQQLMLRCNAAIDPALAWQCFRESGMHVPSCCKVPICCLTFKVLVAAGLPDKAGDSLEATVSSTVNCVAW